MIKINVNKKKIIEFDVNVTGVQCEALSGRLSLFYEDIIYSFPATIEDGNVIKIEVPVLNDIISDIPDKHKVDMRLEVVGKDTFMLPWAGQAYLEHPVTAEATMRGATLVEDEEPKISVDAIREEEKDCPEGQQWCSIQKKCITPPGKGRNVDVDEAKYDTKGMATFTGTARKTDPKVPKKKDSKLAKALDGEEDEEKKKEKEKKEPKKLGEQLAKALLGEQFKPKSVKEVQKKADQLTKKLKRSKMRENFGQKELRQLEDFSGWTGAYDSPDRQKIQAIIDKFSNWVMNYTG